jgi:phosphoglycolate phosphatase-like HAD superfamily hydrolase
VRHPTPSRTSFIHLRISETFRLPASRRTILPCVAWMLFLGLCSFSGASAQPADPLPSWNEGSAKQAILRFVREATKAGASIFVPRPERIATFDNDGTLWVEQPMYVQMAFALDRVKAMAPQHPEWKTQEPFKSVSEGNLKGVMAGGEKAIFEIIATTHAGMTTDVFARTVTDWLAEARHPRFHRSYTELVYEPMLELLAYLRSNGFKTFIVSGGGVDFMRPWTEKAYGIPPEQVVGSVGETKLELKDGRPVLMKLPKIDLVDDKAGKPVGIQRFIGRRPILAFGNSDGDQQMLEWAAAGTGVRFMGIIHHTDAEREWSYDRKSPIGTLDKAWDEAVAKGWTVVDMKKDWKAIFPASPQN